MQKTIDIRQKSVRLLAFLILLTVLPNNIAAEVLHKVVDKTTDDGGWRFSLVTCAPGREIYQLEGHTALRARHSGGVDLAINWGVFDFQAPNFVYRFVKGETDYMAAAYPFYIFLEEYRKEGRHVVEQELNLSPQQSEKLIQLVEENLQTEKRTYRYNYVKDNCATRPLALIERAAAPVILAVGEDTQQTTFRSEMTDYHSAYPWYQFGIDLALGADLDYPITERERTFAPIRLQEALGNAKFRYPDGKEAPVVKSTNVLVEGDPSGVADAPTPWPLTPMAVGIYLLVLTVAFSLSDIIRHKLSRWLDTLIFGAQFLAGCLLTFLIFISVHEATSPNWLYLWLNPLCIIGAAGVWIKRWKRVVYWYQICNFAALTVLLSAHHFLGQAFNAAFPIYILCALIRSATDVYVLHPHIRHNTLKH